MVRLALMDDLFESAWLKWSWRRGSTRLSAARNIRSCGVN
jgi:hypothetical protein